MRNRAAVLIGTAAVALAGLLVPAGAASAVEQIPGPPAPAGYSKLSSTFSTRNSCDTYGLRGQNNRWWVKYYWRHEDWSLFSIWVKYN